MNRIEKQSFYDQIINEYRVKNAKAKANKQPEPGIPILTQSTLRLEQFINRATSNYQFGILTNQTTPGTPQVLATEIRLEQNDNFHIYSIGFYLAVTAASTNTAFRLQTNANEIFLGSAAIALDYMNLWNGTLNINVNQIDVLTNWNLEKHFFVGQTQRLAAAVNNNFDQVDLSQNGVYPVAPSIMLSGAYTNKINISLPTAIATALVSDNTRMVLVFEGLRAQNAAIRKGSVNN